jgi:hypothetical protein
VGDVAKIRLWHEKWYGDQDLKDIFLDLYSIACVKDASWQATWSYPMILISEM